MRVYKKVNGLPGSTVSDEGGHGRGRRKKVNESVPLVGEYWSKLTPEELHRLKDALSAPRGVILGLVWSAVIWLSLMHLMR